MIRVLIPAASPWTPSMASTVADILQILSQDPQLTFEVGAIVMPISQMRKLVTVKFGHRGLLEYEEDYSGRQLAASYFIAIWLQILVCSGISANLVSFLQLMIISLWLRNRQFCTVSTPFLRGGGYIIVPHLINLTTHAAYLFLLPHHQPGSGARTARSRATADR